MTVMGKSQNQFNNNKSSKPTAPKREYCKECQVQIIGDKCPNLACKVNYKREDKSVRLEGSLPDDIIE